MANNENQSKSKQYRIYIKEAKRWVDVNKEFYTKLIESASRSTDAVSVLPANVTYATWIASLVLMPRLATSFPSITL